MASASGQWMFETATSIVRATVAPDKRMMRYLTYVTYLLIAYNIRTELQAIMRVLQTIVAIYPLTIAALLLSRVSSGIESTRVTMVLEIVILWMRCLQSPSPPSTDDQTRRMQAECVDSLRSHLAELTKVIDPNQLYKCATFYARRSSNDLRTVRVVLTAMVTIGVVFRFSHA